jgi:hypothetical protein
MSALSQGILELAGSAQYLMLYLLAGPPSRKGAPTERLEESHLSLPLVFH